MSTLKGKTAVVTGGSQGIGAGIVKELATQGANVVFNYNTNKEPAEELARELRTLGAKALVVKADVTSAQDLEALFTAASQEFGVIDILVNNAGVFTFNPVESITRDEVNRIFQTNVIAPMFVIQAALKNFNDGGSIINIGSIAATRAPANALAYSSSKCALDGVTKVLSKELASRRITVNQINPGSVTTEGTRRAGVTDEVEKQLIAEIPLGRIGTPADIAYVTAFLASEEARWITGETIRVSGGGQ